MPYQNFIYKLNFPLYSEDVNMRFNDRIWSCRPIDHSAFILCDADANERVRIWFLIYEHTEPNERAMADMWKRQCGDALLVLTLSDTTERCVHVVQDVLFALECDWIHSCLANADFEDLVDVLGTNGLSGRVNHSSVRIGSAISTCAEDYLATLDTAWKQAVRQNNFPVLLIRANALKNFTIKSQEFLEWLKTERRDFCFYWDIFDPNLQHDQKRFTFLVRE